MKKRILTLGIVLALVATMVMPVAALASNEASQEASILTYTEAIEIVDKDTGTAVATITFPQAAAGATVNDPYNDVDGDTDPQALSGTVSEPVARIYNNTGQTLQVWLEITDWTSAVVTAENFELVDTTTTTVDAVNDVLSADGNTATVDTTIDMTTGTYKALYLEVVLSNTPGLTGSSTLAVLGGAP